MFKIKMNISHATWLALSLAVFLFIFYPKISLAATTTVRIFTDADPEIYTHDANLYGDFWNFDWDTVRNQSYGSIHYSYDDKESTGGYGSGVYTASCQYAGYLGYEFSRSQYLFKYNIPASSTIVSIDFGVKFYEKIDNYNDEYAYIAVVSSNPEENFSMSLSDYDDFGTEILSNKNDISNIDDSGNYFTIFNINQAGLKFIKNDEEYNIIKLGLREGHDIENNICKAYSGVKGYYAESDGTSSDPYLEITYTTPDEPGDQDFRFVHLTDTHLGSNWLPGAFRWNEEDSYPRFTDTLFDIERLTEAPEFIIVSGDLVEYSRSEWFDDFQSIVDSFSAETGVPVYVVPGNHDRYRDATGGFQCGIMGKSAVHCDDYLENYFDYISNPGITGANYLVAGDSGSYRYENNGFMFIGLDTGADFWPDYEASDKAGGPEADGLTDAQMAALNSLATATPKIVFMHSPAMSGTQDACTAYGCPEPSVEDGSFVNKYREFLDFVSNSNVQLVLSGHTHESHVFDSLDKEYDHIPDDIRPLFIQTPSATKDGNINHGYRIIDIAGGVVAPAEPVSTEAYPKKVSHLYSDDELTLKYYDPNNSTEFVTPVSRTGLSVPVFTASGSEQVIIYDEAAGNSKIDIAGIGNGGKKYDLEVRQEGVAIENKYNRRAYGFYIRPSLLSFISGHIEAENGLAKLWLKNIKLNDYDSQRLLIDWPDFISNRGKNGITLAYDYGGDNIFDLLPELKPLPASISVDLDSPGELRVIDADGNITGLVNHEKSEDIPFSLYEDKEERVTVYFENEFSNEQFYFEVHGLEDPFNDAPDTYSLTIDLDQEASTTGFKAINLPLQAGGIHRYLIDWEELTSGGSGVQLLIDSDGNGVFEQALSAGTELSGDEYVNIAPRRIKMHVKDSLLAVLTGDQSIDDKINAVVEKIDNSLADEYWRDDFHPEAKNGEKVFVHESQALASIDKYLLLNKVLKNNNLPEGVIAAFMEARDGLVKADRIIAKSAWNDAAPACSDGFFNGICKSLFDWVEQKLNSGLELENTLPTVAINFYKEVWKKVN